METEHLILRKFDINDSLKLYENVYSDASVNRFLYWGIHNSFKETESFVEELM